MNTELSLVLAEEQCKLLAGLRRLFELLDVALPPVNEAIPPRGGLVPSIEIAIYRTQTANQMVKGAIEVCERAMCLLEGADRPARPAK